MKRVHALEAKLTSVIGSPGAGSWSLQVPPGAGPDGARWTNEG